jgi:hypothetical protein
MKANPGMEKYMPSKWQLDARDGSYTHTQHNRPQVKIRRDKK